MTRARAFLVDRFYQAADGDLPEGPVPVRLDEFQPDTEAIGNGVFLIP